MASHRPTPLRRVAPEAGGVLVLLAVLGVIELMVRYAIINPFLVPQPSAIALSFGRIIVEEDVIGRFLLTGSEAGIAAVLVAGLGVPLGALLWRARLLRLAVSSWVAGLAAAPIVLAYPLFLVMFGRSPWTIITIGALAGLPPVILMTMDSLHSVHPVLINVGKSLRLQGWGLFWKVMFPAALPGIFSGLRIGLIFALINIVGVEFLINFGGLGPLINELAERYDLPGTYAAIGFVVLISIVVFLILETLEKWLRPSNR